MEQVLVPHNDSLTATSPLEYHTKVNALQAWMEGEVQADIPLRHYFVLGLYAREVDIKAGTLMVSKIHKTEHLFILSKGSLSVLTENGVVKLTAPHTMITKPGTRRVAYAHDDSVVTTFHVTNKTDLAEIEADIIAAVPDNTPSLIADVCTLLKGV